MKLNNKGWGLTYLIVAGCIIILVLIITSIKINNLIKESKNSSDSNQSEKTNNNDYDFSSFYTSLEESLIKAGQSYSLYHSTLIENSGNYTLVTFDTLKSEGYIDNLPDPSGGKSCDGYILIYSDYSIKSFIECEKYKTEQYDEWID